MIKIMIRGRAGNGIVLWGRPPSSLPAPPGAGETDTAFGRLGYARWLDDLPTNSRRHSRVPLRATRIAGARVHRAFPFLKAADEELRTQQLERLKTGQRGPLSPQATMVKSVDEFAIQSGFSKDTFLRAKHSTPNIQRNSKHQRTIKLQPPSS